MTPSMFESSASSAPREGLYGLPRGAARPRGLRAGADAFAESPYFAAVLLGTAAWFLLLNDSRGAVTAMALAFCTVMLFCRDVLCALLPLLLALLCTVDHYEDLRYFLDLWWLAAPVLLAVTVRLVRTPVRRAGRCRRGLLAVSAAVLLGGLGRLPLGQALSPLALYYTLGLSAGMLAVYRLARGTVSSGAEARARFADTLYAAGIFAAFLVLRVYCIQLHRFLRTGATLYFSYRNYCATMLLLALPVPFLRALEQPRHLMSAGVLYLALLLSGSRSGLLFGTVLILLAAAGLLHWDPARRGTYLQLLQRWGIPAAAFTVFLALVLFSERFSHGLLTEADADRVSFLRRALRDFLDNPLFGQGLGSRENAFVFSGVPGSLVFYHNYVAQILGSLGLAGAAAYGLQLRDRVVLLRRSWNPQTAALGLSALGMLLMSMTNPGAFCPVPYELLMVTLFALLEQK